MEARDAVRRHRVDTDHAPTCTDHRRARSLLEGHRLVAAAAEEEEQEEEVAVVEEVDTAAGRTRPGRRRLALRDGEAAAGEAATVRVVAEAVAADSTAMTTVVVAEVQAMVAGAGRGAHRLAGTGDIQAGPVTL